MYAVEIIIVTSIDGKHSSRACPVIQYLVRMVMTID